MKRGEGNLVSNVLIYWVLLLVFAFSMFTFISRHQGNVYAWEAYYGFILAKTIDNAQPGDVVRVDVSPAVQIGAKYWKNTGAEHMFVLNDAHHEVGVQLRPGSMYWYSFVTAKQVGNWHVDTSGSRTIVVFEVKA